MAWGGGESREEAFEVWMRTGVVVRARRATRASVERVVCYAAVAAGEGRGESRQDLSRGGGSSRVSKEPRKKNRSRSERGGGGGGGGSGGDGHEGHSKRTGVVRGGEGRGVPEGGAEAMGRGAGNSDDLKRWATHLEHCLCQPSSTSLREPRP